MYSGSDSVRAVNRGRTRLPPPRMLSLPLSRTSRNSGLLGAAYGGPASPEQPTLSEVPRSSAMIVGAGILPALQGSSGWNCVATKSGAVLAAPAFWPAFGGPASPGQPILSEVPRSSAMIVGAGILPALQGPSGWNRVATKSGAVLAAPAFRPAFGGPASPEQRGHSWRPGCR